MKNFIIGFLVGMSITGVAWAYSGTIILRSASGVAISADNPLPIRSY